MCNTEVKKNELQEVFQTFWLTIKLQHFYQIKTNISYIQSQKWQNPNISQKHVRS